MSIIRDDIAAYINRNYTPLNRDLARIRREGEERHIPVILRDSEGLMIDLLLMQKPERILEIGTGTGYSSILMSTVCPYAKIVTLEKDVDRFDEAEKNIKDLGLEEKIWIVEGDARDILDAMGEEADEETLFDFIFIDAAKSHYREFYDKAVPMAAAGAVVLCDNVLIRGDVAEDREVPERKHRTSIMNMRKFLEYVIREDERGHTSLLPIGDGMTLTYIK